MFGIASCSYDGATDRAFVTPAAALLEIEIAHSGDRAHLF
jgi:hypothetical protein